MFHPNLPRVGFFGGRCQLEGFHMRRGGAGAGLLARAARGVRVDLEGATPASRGTLSSDTHLGHLAFSHDAGPLPLSTSTYVCSPVCVCVSARDFNSPSSLKGVYRGGDPTLFIDASPDFTLSSNGVGNTDNAFDRSA